MDMPEGVGYIRYEECAIMAVCLNHEFLFICERPSCNFLWEAITVSSEYV